MAGGRVELAGRLVGEEHGGPVGERASDGDALHLTAGELRGAVPGAVGQPHVGEQLARPRPPLAARTPASAIGQLDVLARRQDGQQMKALKDEAEPGQPKPRQVAVGEGVEPRTEDLDTPADGVSMPPSSWSRVDLPLPEGPTIAT